MKKVFLPVNFSFRNGKDSLKITWVSAWQGAEVFHAQEFPERWSAKGSQSGQRQFPSLTRIPSLKRSLEKSRGRQKETEVIHLKRIWRFRHSRADRSGRGDAMKKNYAPFRNGKNSLKFNWVSARRGANVFGAAYYTVKDPTPVFHKREFTTPFWKAPWKRAEKRKENEKSNPSTEIG